MTLARMMPDIARDSASVDELCNRFLNLIVSATGAIAGVVVDLQTEQSWPRFEVAPSVATPSHLNLLRQVCSGDASELLFADAPENETGFMLVLRPFTTPVIEVGIVQLLQRPGAPREAGAGYLQFLDQMTTYFEQSPVLVGFT